MSKLDIEILLRRFSLDVYRCLDPYIKSVLAQEDYGDTDIKEAVWEVMMSHIPEYVSDE